MSTEQRENLDAILRQSVFPAGADDVVSYFHGGVYVDWPVVAA